MKEIARLFAAVRAISPQADLRFIQVPDHPDMWVVRVAVGNVIIIETGGGLPMPVMQEAAKRLESMSQRILQAIRPEG